MCLDVFQLLARHLLFQGENKNEETPMHLLQCRYEFHRGIFVLECNSKTIQSLGFVCNNLAAFKNTSGSGFALVTLVPSTMASNCWNKFTFCKIQGYTIRKFKTQSGKAIVTRARSLQNTHAR